MVSVLLLAIVLIFAVKMYEYFHEMKEGYRVTDYKHMKYLMRMGMQETALDKQRFKIL